MANYLIVLFKNKKRKKIINKFKTLKRAESFFDKEISNSNNTLFEVRYEGNLSSDYEISIVQVGKNVEGPVYIKDEFGRTSKVKVEDENFAIVRISPYKVEEVFFDNQKNKRIKISDFIRRYLSGDGMKMISSLNNRVVVQEEEKTNLFTFKNELDCQRFLDVLTNEFIKIKRKDCLIVKDTSTAQKKYLYDILEQKGYNKRFLYRKFTSLPQ